MLRIDPRSAVATVAAAPRSARAGAASFSPIPGRSRDASAAGGAAPLATLDAILALQSEDDPSERRRRSARRGQDLLGELDRLKAGLLSGAVATADLRRLAGRLDGPPSGDPTLDAIMGAIELRAKVELAKLGMA